MSATRGLSIFPADWLDTEPRNFCGAKAYTAGECFEYCIKECPRLLSPQWSLRAKDKEALAYLREHHRARGTDARELLRRIWGFTPFWVKEGYPQYAMPTVAAALEPLDRAPLPRAGAWSR